MTVDRVETDAVVRRIHRRRWRRAIALLVVVVALIVLRRPLFLGNFGTVDPGRVYRSAQPRGDLDALLDPIQPASILNLRGGSIGDDWYVDEVREAEERGIDFYDFPMSAERRPSRRELLTLLDLFERARYPMLIHCKKGADRTGLACALYLMSSRGVGPEAAEKSFSLSHGHVPLLGPERLHEPLDEYAQWLEFEGVAHSPARLRSWVATEYRDASGAEEGPAFRPLAPGPRVQRSIARAVGLGEVVPR